MKELMSTVNTFFCLGAIFTKLVTIVHQLDMICFLILSDAEKVKGNLG